MSVLGLVFLALTSCGPGEPTFTGNVLDPPMPAVDFTLTDQYGQLFGLSDQRGKVVVLFFGYTSCPDVCPTTLGVWNRVYNELGEDAEQVRFVFVTVDPERDTLDRLRDHLAIFSADFVGLTGTAEELAAVYQAYGVYAEREELADSELGYQITHTASAYVIDREGNWRLRHLFGTPPEDVAHDLRQLLR
jgi:protein SCO1/2